MSGKEQLIEMTLNHSPTEPFDHSVGLYCRVLSAFAHPLEYTGWEDETPAFKESCAIFAGLVPNPTVRIIGPDVIKLLSDCTTNSHATFPVGRIKHVQITDDNGLIQAHGLTVRVGEEEVHTYSLSPWIDYAATKGDYKVKFEDYTMREFNLQCTGPTTLEMLELASGDDLHDIPFMGHRMSKINGIPVRIFRMGMAYTLGYEVHGPMEHARDIYAKVYEAGKSYDVRRIGWLCYASQLSECGYPQENYLFRTSSMEDQGFIDFLKKIGHNPNQWPGTPILCGSSGKDVKKRYRNPIELGWYKSVTFDHNFPGKDVLKRLASKPERTIKTLKWNSEDVIDLFASLFREGEEPYPWMDFPIERVFSQTSGSNRLFQDDVFDKDGNLVGVSSGRTYSSYSRDMFSMGIINTDYAEEGTELFVLYGEPGKRQKKIHAVVAKFPHVDTIPNYKFDVENIPHVNK